MLVYYQILVSTGMLILFVRGC